MFGKAVHEFPVFRVRLFYPSEFNLFCLCIDYLNLRVPLSNNFISHLARRWVYISFEAKVALLRPTSFVKFDLNILLIGACQVSNIASASRVNIYISNDKVVNTHWRWLESETFIVRRQVHIFLELIRECEGTSAKLIFRSIYSFSWITLISQCNTCANGWMMWDLLSQKFVFSWHNYFKCLSK